MTVKPVILMIDNNLGDQQLVQIACEEVNCGVDIRIAMDGTEGVAALQAMLADRSPPFDLVLLDLNMPRLDGRQVLLWARRQAGLADLPIIVLTSSEASQDRAACLAAGATDFVVKPANYEGYLQLIPAFLAQIKV